MFAYLMAIYYRRDVGLHALHELHRAAAAAARPWRALGHYVLPDGASFAQAFHISFFVAELVVVALLAADALASKVRAPYVILLVLLIVQQASYEWSMQFGPWQALVGAMTGR
ncbi:hypothetical protein LP420_25545 [Massilia sp. B-10]|nr:hypothetical protein LP420_25545 [Massilia sp. B-10]